MLAMRPSLPLMLLATVAAAQTAAPKLPYKTIDQPNFIPAAQATFLQDGDRVIGVTEGAIAKAYPAAILAQHGVCQDSLPDGPIAVTW